MQPLNLADYGNYVATVAQHYQGVIDAYEIWNEPWSSTFWSLDYEPAKGSGVVARFIPSQVPAVDYARLQQTAFRAARAVDPNLKVVGFVTTGGKLGAMDKAIMNAVELDTCDVISYHHYTGDHMGVPGDSGTDAYQSATGGLGRRQTLSQPVWLSEGGPDSIGDSSGASITTLCLPKLNQRIGV